MLIQAAVEQAPVKAFNKCILSGFLRLDEAELYFGFVRPEKHGLAGQLRTIVQHDRGGNERVIASSSR